MMKIEEGKSYRTRGGQKIGPAVPTHRFNAGNGYPWAIGDFFLYTADGIAGSGSHPAHDIVAEWVDAPTGPVLVETVKRIVPGTHNGLEVKHFGGEAGVYITADAGLWDASKLRAGAAVLMQYADALDEGAR